MDSATALSTTTLSNRKNSKHAPSKHALFFATYRRNQTWSLPDSVIYYMVKNPTSSKCYEMLIKSCKYFFIKNPILVIKSLRLYFEGHKCSIFLDDEYVDLQNISSELWITNELCVGNIDDENPDVQYLSFSVLPKIYKSDIKRLSLDHQNMFFDDLIWLVSKCESISLHKVTVKDENGEVVSLEKIIVVSPNVKDFFYNFPNTTPNIVTSDTVKELVNVPHFLTLEKFELIDVPESFNIDDFYSYIKRNKQTIIRLRFFVRQISDAYEQRLQDIVNEIVQSGEHDYNVPYIFYPGIEHSSYEKLRKLYWSD